MPFSVQNQMPQVLTWQHKEAPANAFDALAALDEVVTSKITTPYNQSTPVSITDAQGHAMSDDELRDLILTTCGSNIDPAAEDEMKGIYSQTLIRYKADTNLTAQEVFATQSGIAAKLPEPTPRTIYDAGYDVKPTAMEFISGACGYDKLFATFAFYARPNTLGYYFKDETVFDDFKAHFSAQAQAAIATGQLDSATTAKITQFQQIALDKLTESLILRVSDTDDCQPFSFSRILTSALMTYATTANTPEEFFGCMPFQIGELICPRTIVFVNVERHARATPRAIEDEWQLIRKSLSTPITLVSNSQLKSLTASARMHSRLTSTAMHMQQMNQKNKAMRSMSVAFPAHAPSRERMLRMLKKVLAKMETVSRSENIFKRVKSSFARPSRRNPDDFNLKGKIVSTRYMPDIHVYVDTSGSISEKNYCDAIQICIALAKKLDVNLYFNSFSHVMSQTTLLKTRNCSTAEAYRQFQKVPKVGGGTDFEQIWNFINASKRRKRELSLIITDLGYNPPTRYVEHPKYCYYIPCAMMDWKTMTAYAKDFVRHMTHIDPAIRAKILC